LFELKLLWVHTGSGKECGEVLPAAVYAAAMQLVLACIRSTSAIIEVLPADWVMADSWLESALHMACQAALGMLNPCDKILSKFTLAALDEAGGRSQGVPGIDAEQLLLLQSPHFIQGVGLMVALTACADFVTAHAAASHLSSSSSGRDGSNEGGSGSSGERGSSSSSSSGGSGGSGGGSGGSGGGSGGFGSNEGGSGSNEERGSSSSGGSSSGRGSSSSLAWLHGVTTDSELRWKIHEEYGMFAPHFNSSGSSGSSGSNGSSDAFAVAQRLFKGQLHVVEGAWDMANSGDQLLPGPINQLLQLLGVSSKAGMWGAYRLVDRIVIVSAAAAAGARAVQQPM
jgi:hypothetical protein